MSRIIARVAEQRRLRELLESTEAELVAIYGRRRVGKTFLVREVLGPHICFEQTGSHRAPLAEQLANFSDCMAAAGAPPQTPPRSWRDAFAALRRHLERLGSTKRRVVFLDELPWLASRRSGFLRAFEHFWNGWASAQRNLIVVVCGSAASWMIDSLLRARGGLHNRVTARIRLEPFTLGEARQYLSRGGVDFGFHQTLEVYLALGGIPFYLREVERAESAAQAIDRICFSPSGLLRNEFRDLFASLFEHSDRHEAVVRALAGRRSGMTRAELIAATDHTSGGGMTSLLDELEQSGFVSRLSSFGRAVRDSVYRLADPYSAFHLHWLDRRRPTAGSWVKKRNAPAFRAWSGLAFESVCIAHVDALERALGISGVETVESTWQHHARSPGEDGAQIDLLIDRADGCINICEMKLTDDQFTIDKRYAESLRRKVRVFREITSTKKSTMLTFVTSRGVRRNQYARELVAREVTVEELFA